MLQRESIVVVTDNTWAKRALIIGIPNGTKKKTARVGDIVVVVIKSASSTWIVKKAQVMRAMVVRTKKEIARKDGTYIRFGDNAVILLDIDDKGQLNPKGKRIFGPIAKEIRAMGRKDISNMAPEVI